MNFMKLHGKYLWLIYVDMIFMICIYGKYMIWYIYIYGKYMVNIYELYEITW